MENIKDDIKRNKVLEVYNKLNLTNISFSNKIKQRAVKLKQSYIKDMDALHLAYAGCGNLDYFITADRILINATSRVKDLKQNYKRKV